MPEQGANDTVSITVNGRRIAAEPGELIIDAAERNGTYIPRFCYHSRMDPVGMCRMCLVDIDTGRGPALQPSCMVTVTPDMVVETESPRVKKAQEGVLEFLLINHPLDCPVCDKGGECPLQDHTMAQGPGESRFVEEKRHYEKPIAISENVFLDRERCILCDRCTRFAKDVAGDALIHFIDRGNGTQVNTFPDHPFASYFSGNTVQICPVGALTAEPYRFKARPWDLESVESTCRDCAVGCRILIQSSQDRVLRHVGVDSDPVNWSWLCDKGRFGFEAVDSEHRLTSPQVDDGNGFTTTRWTDALRRTAMGISAGLHRNGPAGFAVIGGARLSNESAYAWTRFAKAVIGSDNVDAQLGDGIDATAFAGLPRSTIDEACAKGATILSLGTDLKDELPVLFLRVRDAVTRRGARIVELSPRDTSLSPLASHTLRCDPGSVDSLVDAVLAGEGDMAPVRAALGAGPLTIVLGRPSVGESDRAALSAALKVLAAFPDAKVLSALRRSNVHGALDLGMAPGLLPGRVALSDGADHYTAAWGNVPEATGLDTAGILAAAAEGRIDTLVLLGADPLNDFPDRELARRGLAGAKTLVAVETFANESTEMADIVLPAAGPAEVSGTVTNLEGRITVLRPKVTAPGTARPDWQIAVELAHLLGADMGFDDVASIWAEIEGLSPLHHGITAAALAAEPDGIVADRRPDAEPVEATEAAEPVDADGGDAPEAPGTPEAPDGAAETSDDVEPAGDGADDTSSEAFPPLVGPPSVEYSAPPVDAYSLRLVTARRLYDRATMTSMSPSLADLGGSSSARVNPTDLERLGAGDGDVVTLRSSRGAVTTPVAADPNVPAGTVVVTWNQGDPAPNGLVDTSAAVTEVRLESRS